MKKIVLSCAALATCLAGPAHAQFGGLAPKIPGVGKGDDSGKVAVTGDQVDQFLAKTVNSTRYIAIAMLILNEAAAGHASVGAKKAEITALSQAQDVKALNTQKEQLTSAADALSANKDLVSQFRTTYQAANAKEKAQMAAAVYNFALFLPQLAQMPKNITDMISGIGSNPRLLGKVSELKTAGSLIGVQIKGTATVIKVLPELMSVAKVKAPANAQSSKPQDVDPSSLS